MNHVVWSRGGEARVVKLDGERIVLASTTPAAPGTPLEGALALGTKIRVKVARCRRTANADPSVQGRVEVGFVIEGRLVDASRDVRATLAALASDEGQSAS
jgi:hypothetical protein